jgi:hypothetical protein
MTTEEEREKYRAPNEATSRTRNHSDLSLQRLRWLLDHDGTPYTDVTGPDGYNATGYRWSNGDENWHVNNWGTHRHCNNDGW